MRSIFRHGLMASATAIVAIAGPVNAQDASTPSAPAAEENRGFEDIVVTARRSNESLTSVPVAVTALGGPELARYSSTDLSRVAQLVPQVSLQAGGEGGGGTFVIRGIGSTADEAGIEQSVGIVIDGTPVGRGRILSQAMFDIQQIEILKGPQALFFGKNSPAGVISVRSVDPVLGKFEGYARTGYEFRADERYAEGAVSVPLGETFAVRLAGRVSKLDGWVKTSLAPAPDPNGAITGANPILPGEYNVGPGAQSEAGRFTALWQPIDRLKSNLKLTYSRYRDEGSQFETVCPGQDHPFSAATNQVATTNDCKLDRERHATAIPLVYGTGIPYEWADGIGYSWVHSFVGSWSNDYDLSDHLTVSAITGYYKLSRDGFANSNGSIFSEYSHFPPLTRNNDTLPDARAFMEQLVETTPLPDLPVDVSIRSISREGEEGEIMLVFYRPTGEPGALPALLDIHGGGYIAGTARIGGPRNAALAHDLGCLIVSVDYRLAPEAPYPAGLNDCYTALCWLHGHAAELGVDTSRIAIGGDSAGGGLTAALALMARDQGGVPLVAQILTYPMLDDRTSSTLPSHPLAGEYLWDAPSNRYAWECYLGKKPGGDVFGYSVPGRFADLSKLPPALIAVGQLDLFIIENLDYARRLIEAGVPTELHVYPGAVHGFDLMPDATSTKAYAQAVRNALRRAFARA